MENTENRYFSESEVQQAKAFEAGRLIMGTFIELSGDSDYAYQPILARIEVYLEDLGVQNIEYDRLFPITSTQEFRKVTERINQQLWIRTPVGQYFEASLHLFEKVATGDIDGFKEIVNSISIPETFKI